VRAGDAGENTEIPIFEGDQICRSEVYFSWDVR
jgi:hypothetical protein